MSDYLPVYLLTYLLFYLFDYLFGYLLDNLSVRPPTNWRDMRQSKPGHKYNPAQQEHIKDNKFPKDTPTTTIHQIRDHNIKHNINCIISYSYCKQQECHYHATDSTTQSSPNGNAIYPLRQKPPIGDRRQSWPAPELKPAAHSPAGQPARLLVCLVVCLLAFLSVQLLAYLLTCPTTYLNTYSPTCVHICLST